MDGALQYYLFDAHGDVLHRLDASGNMLKTYRYDAFGNEIDPEPLDTNPFRYCGEYFDREIGTYYLRARNYDPRIGRFTTEDPARKDLNYYVYGRNNPIKFTDPTGMASRIPLNNYYDSQEYQDFVKGNKKDPWDIAYHQGRTAVTFPIKENTNGRTYPGHGNSKDFIADKGTTIHAATGGIVDRVDWGYADDYTVRGFKNDKGQISYYEVDASGNIKRDNNGAPIIGNPYGNSIRIRMADDSIAIYAHMSYSESAPVEVGNYVFIDAPIGQVGNTGNSFGSHLHSKLETGRISTPSSQNKEDNMKLFSSFFPLLLTCGCSSERTPVYNIPLNSSSSAPESGALDEFVPPPNQEGSFPYDFYPPAEGIH